MYLERSLTQRATSSGLCRQAAPLCARGHQESEWTLSEGLSPRCTRTGLRGLPGRANIVRTLTLQLTGLAPQLLAGCLSHSSAIDSARCSHNYLIRRSVYAVCEDRVGGSCQQEQHDVARCGNGADLRGGLVDRRQFWRRTLRCVNIHGLATSSWVPLDKSAGSTLKKQPHKSFIIDKRVRFIERLVRCSFHCRESTHHHA